MKKPDQERRFLTTVSGDESVEGREFENYTVHIYAVVRVKVSHVKAESQKAAIEKVEQCVDLHQIFNLGSPCSLSQPNITNVEYAEEIVGFLVDAANDPENQNTTQYEVVGGELVKSMDVIHQRKGKS